MDDVSKLKVLAHYLHTRESTEVMVASMSKLICGMVQNVPFATLRVFQDTDVHLESANEVTALYGRPVPISWAGGGILRDLERDQENARNALVGQIDAPLFKSLLESPLLEWSDDGFLEALDSLSEGGHPPLLLMGTHAYVAFRKAPDWCDVGSNECQITTIACGRLGTIKGCPVYVSKNLKDMRDVFIVSRRSSQVRGPVEVTVKLASYDSSMRELSLSYEARLRMVGAPEVRRFQVGSLGE